MPLLRVAVAADVTRGDDPHGRLAVDLDGRVPARLREAAVGREEERLGVVAGGRAGREPAVADGGVVDPADGDRPDDVPGAVRRHGDPRVDAGADRGGRGGRGRGGDRRRDQRGDGGDHPDRPHTRDHRSAGRGTQRGSAHRGRWRRLRCMTVRVRLFAMLRERAGRDVVELELPDGASVADALAALADVTAGITCVLAVNRDYAEPGARPGRRRRARADPARQRRERGRRPARGDPARAALARRARRAGPRPAGGRRRHVLRGHPRRGPARVRGLRGDGARGAARHRPRGDRAPRAVRGGGRAPRRRGPARRAERARGGERGAPRRGVRGGPRDHRRDQGPRADLEGRGRRRRAPVGGGDRSPGAAPGGTGTAGGGA